MIRNFYFPIHLNGGNRGCEGIAKGTANILDCPKEQLHGLCSNLQLDKKLHIDSYYTLHRKRKVNSLVRILNKVYDLFNMCINRNCERSLFLQKIIYNPFLKKMNRVDVMVSTGGDMMCYGDNEAIYTNNYVKNRGAITILWGCSMGEENLTESKLKTLKKFDLIYARESLTYDFFKSLGLKNVVCYPDPAFVLNAEEVELPECFKKGKVVGVNLSNYVVGAFNLNTPFGGEVRKMFDYIFAETDYHVLLIPHVLWKEQDDRIIAKSVIDEYIDNNKRITILNSEDFNYQQIRYIISKCHMFIGGRTHAVISAYSTCVPTIALGYSIKSRGIAKDLNLTKYVVDCKHIQKEGVLLELFKSLDNNSSQIKSQLSSIIPEYIRRTEGIKKDIDRLKFAGK